MATSDSKYDDIAGLGTSLSHPPTLKNNINPIILHEKSDTKLHPSANLYAPETITVPQQ